MIVLDERGSAGCAGIVVLMLNALLLGKGMMVRGRDDHGPMMLACFTRTSAPGTRPRRGTNESDVGVANQLQNCRAAAGTSDDNNSSVSLETLIKNIPSTSDQWKAPVNEWVRSLYQQKIGSRKPKAAPPAVPPDSAPQPEPSH